MIRASRLVLLAAIAVAACAPEPVEPSVRRTVEGDVTTVENLVGSAWGGPAMLVEEAAIGVLEGEDPYMLGRVRGVASTDERIYVLDASVPTVRVYDHEGKYLRDIGRGGQGPGEFESPTGLAMNPDGLVLVLDAVGPKVIAYGAEGAYLSTWKWETSFLVLRAPTILSRPGGAWVADIRFPDMDDRSVFDSGYRAIGPDGAVDAMNVAPKPEHEIEPASVPGGRGNGEAMPINGLILYAPKPLVAMGPDGSFYTGDGAQYRFRVHRPDGTQLVVTRHGDPVAVGADEADAHVARAEAMVRKNFSQPAWRYNGPEPPAAKAAFNVIYPETRVWFAREGPSRLADGCDPAAALERLETCWRSDVYWDAFATDGTYLGMVQPPADAWLMWSHIDGNRVTTVVIDEDGLVRVLRLRLEMPMGSR